MLSVEMHIANDIAARYELALRDGIEERDAVFLAISAFRSIDPKISNLEACQAVLDIIDGWSNHLTAGEREEALTLIGAPGPVTLN